MTVASIIAAGPRVRAVKPIAAQADLIQQTLVTTRNALELPYTSTR